MHLPLPEELDLDRLQRVVDKIHHSEFYWFERGEGQTVARIYLMFGELEAGDPGSQYMYVGENSICAKWASSAFLELVHRVFPEMENSVKGDNTEWYPDTIVLPNGQAYRFASVDYLVTNLDQFRGYTFDKIFFDVSAEKQHLYDRDGRLMEAFTVLEHAGAEFV